MRVLHVYSGNLYGGIETFLVTLARQRDLCPEMEPYFALCFEGRLSDELIAAGADVYQLGQVRASKPVTIWRARRALARLLRRLRFDVAICHSAWPQAMFGPTISSSGTPLVYWQHDAANGRHWTERWARLSQPDLVLSNSQFTASTLSLLYPNARPEVICYPVTPPSVRVSKDKRNEIRAGLNTPSDAVVIIQVSRMEEWKGHTFHLQALGQLRELPGWICWFVGGAQRPHEIEYENELKALANQLGIADRVRFAGQRDDVPSLLNAANMHCQPNLGAEPFGITFIEALYSGLPVVTFAMGGASEIVNESCGLLVPSGDTNELAKALERLITDKTLRSSLGGNGPARAAELCDPTSRLRDLRDALASVAYVEAIT